MQLYCEEQKEVAESKPETIIVWVKTNDNNNCQFYDHFWPFFCQLHFIFHKTEVLTIILWCLECLNCYWIKGYHINHILFWQLCFSIFRGKNWPFWPFFDRLWSFFGSYIGIFHNTEIQTVILRCSVCLNLNWIKSYDIIIG